MVYWKLDKYVHSNNNCQGHLYLGNNGKIICAKCGDYKTITYWKLISNSDQLMLESSNEMQNIDMTIAGSIIAKAGLQWFNQFTKTIMEYSKK